MKWHYNINDQPKLGGRSGYEYFPEDKNYLYEIAQCYPRMAVYSDNQGWQHKQFLGSGEFTLPFGDYKVSITAPADHVVAATGTLQNAAQVLTATQQKRLAQAKNAKKPVLIVSQAEAVQAEAKPRQRHQNLDFRRQKRARLCLGQLPQVHLGCHGHEAERQAGDVHVVLPEGGQPALGPVLDRGRGPHHQDLLQVHHSLSVPGGDFGARPGWRHGIPDDFLQRRPPREGRHLLGPAPSTA